MKNKRIIFMVILVSLLLILTGCMSWLGELIPDTGDLLPVESGTVKGIYTFNLSDEENSFAVKDYLGEELKEGAKAIIGISPIDFRTFETKSFKLEISVETSFSSQANLVKDNPNLELTSNSVEESAHLLRRSIDYFSYDGDFTDLAELENSQIDLLTTNRTFFVREDLKNGGNSLDDFKEVNAKIVKIGERLEVYLDETVEEISNNELQRIVNEFDDRIYQILTDNFGDPWDKDENGKTTILITPLQYNGSNIGVSGYFDERNFYDISYSNSSDMIYINSDIFNSTSMTQVYSNIAHEFQHLIFFSEKWDQGNWNRTGDRFEFDYNDIWINEGFSLLASQLTGYLDLGDDPRIFNESEGYFANPAKDGLMVWESTCEISNYGSAGLFAYYLHEHYGNRGILRDITRTNDQIENTISWSAGKNFDEIFSYWMTANVVDRFQGVTDSRYRYNGLTLKSTPVLKKLTSFDTFSVKGMGVQYYTIDGQGSDLRVTLTSNDYNEQMPELNISLIIFE